MSSPGSAVTVELPRWALADRLALGLIVFAGLALEAALANLAAAPPGAGVLAIAVLLPWQWRQRRRRPLAVDVASDAGALRLGDGRCVPFQLGPGSRVLGSTVVLHWRSPHASGALWLTPADVPRDALHRLVVRLVAGRLRAGR